MKKFFFCFMIIIVSDSIHAQDNSVSLSQKTRLDIIVNNIIIANTKLGQIITKYDLHIKSADVNNSQKNYQYEFQSKNSDIFAVISEIEQLGVIDLKNIESFNYDVSLQRHHFDLEYLVHQKELYHQEMSSMQKKDPTYHDFYTKERKLDTRIYEKNKEIMNIKNQTESSRLVLKLSEKMIQDLDSDDDLRGFIHMPGVETTYYHVENDEAPDLEGQYGGGSLRYMFTKGRSYVIIGIMRPLSSDTKDSTINDIVKYSIGKDFYPRYFGRGKKTFFNPFSGFELGGMILTSDEHIDHMFILEPHVGLEIFKNQYVIIDTRVGYIFPLDSDTIKSHRGFSQNISMNIAF